MTITPVATPAAAPAHGTSAEVGSGGRADSGFAALIDKHRPKHESSSGGRRAGAPSREDAAGMLGAASTPFAGPSEGVAALLAGLLAPGASGGQTAKAQDGDGTKGAATDQGAGAAVTGVAGLGPSGVNPVPGVAAVGALSAPGSGPAAAGEVAAGVPTVGQVSGGQAAGPASSASTDAIGFGVGVGVGGASARGSSTASAKGLTAGSGARVTSGTGNPATSAGADTVGSGAGAGSGAAAPATAPTTTSRRAPGGAAEGGTDTGARSTGSAASTTAVVAPAQTTPSPGGVPSEAPAGSGTVPGTTVADQVFGQVTRLVSRGDGTHRLTLRLHPADLGEVKVVLTVKDSTVDVTLSAGRDARDALRAGSPQLRSLLELTGATAGHVVIRDLATGAAPASSASSASPGQPTATGGGPGQQGSGDQTTGFGSGPGDPGGQHAPRDGSSFSGSGRSGTSTMPTPGRRAPAGAVSGAAPRLDLNL